MAENYYNILGVNENSTRDEIKKAYRNLQMRYHPDKNQGSQEAINMTQKINEAYEVLGDPEKKAEYDMMKANPFARMNSNGMSMNMGMNMPMNDLFNVFFGDLGAQMGGLGPNAKIHIFHGPGGFHSQTGPIHFQSMNKPIPIIKNMQVNMEQVLNGGSLPLEIERWTIENGIKVFEKETIYVDVPAGVDEGEIIVLRNRGNVINELCKGDIKICFNILNNTNFKRSGLDLILEKNITLKEALCGFSFEIEYINGKSYTLNNTKGKIVCPEYQKVYPGMGLKRGEHKGNMIIHFHVIFPDNLTEEQIDAISKTL